MNLMKRVDMKTKIKKFCGKITKTKRSNELIKKLSLKSKGDEFCKRLFEVLEKEEKDLKARIAKIDTLDLA